MTARWGRASLVAFLSAAACARGVPRVPAPVSYAAVGVPAADTSRVRRIAVHSRALEGNLLGDSATRNVLVYLPPDYDSAPTKRYRVLYLLHGFGAERNGQNAWLRGYTGFHLGHTLDSLHAAGTVRDLIVVAPDASNFWGGAFYRNSSVAGGWDTFVTRELVGTIDATFRTIASADARALAGHSMGGYGTLSLVTLHPGVFGVAYAMSPCCLAIDPDPEGRNDTFNLLSRARERETIQAGGFVAQAIAALATTYAPNPARPPLLFDPPYVLRGGKYVPDSAVIRKWEGATPLRLVDSLGANLKSLRALGIDAGRQDEFTDIPVLLPRLDALLDTKGVLHRYELYEGRHSNRIGERLTSIVLPFVSRELAH